MRMKVSVLLLLGTVACGSEPANPAKGTAVDAGDAEEAGDAMTAAPSRAVAAGLFFTCASDMSGSVRCLGDNQYGQLGDENTMPSSSPVTVA